MRKAMAALVLIGLLAPAQAPTDVARKRLAAFIKAIETNDGRNPALAFFSPEAFANEQMLGEECAYRGPVNRRILTFLRDHSRLELNQTLWSNMPAWELRRSAINDVKTDGFVLQLLSKAKAADLAKYEAGRAYLLQHLPEGQIYAAFLPLEGSIIYTLWIGPPENLSVSHIGIWCL